MFKFWNWSRDDWTLAVAVIALVLPWIVGAVKRFIKRGSLDIHETAMIEIGYGGAGATIGLVGTLRANDRDLFVQSANLTLIEQKNRSQRQFDWGAFRTAKTIIGTTAGQSGEVSLDVPSGFMISTLEPYRYNILFFDTSLFREMRPILEAVRQAWLAHVTRVNIPSLNALRNLSDQGKLVKALRQAYDKFTATQEYQSAFSKLGELYYWEPGIYNLTLNVYTSRPNRHYSETWSFSLLDTDVDNLRINVNSILEEVCGLPLTLGQYIFIATPYT